MASAKELSDNEFRQVVLTAADKAVGENYKYSTARFAKFRMESKQRLEARIRALDGRVVELTLVADSMGHMSDLYGIVQADIAMLTSVLEFDHESYYRKGGRFTKSYEDGHYTKSYRYLIEDKNRTLSLAQDNACVLWHYDTLAEPLHDCGEIRGVREIRISPQEWKTYLFQGLGISPRCKYRSLYSEGAGRFGSKYPRSVREFIRYLKKR